LDFYFYIKQNELCKKEGSGKRVVSLLSEPFLLPKKGGCQMRRRQKALPVKGQMDCRAPLLRQVRKEKGYTQAAIARRLYVSRGAMASYETGRRIPPEEVIEEIFKMEGRKHG
jgi:DNA-binding XRE family transcriptional regulator